ncbi:MAG TPA: pyridoxal-dependent decarboxylase [Stellaceae bacterium]|jgi:glutamate/tyrosine decarboxylase-like PLP-dependent enzyme|nr:pyridoxal-dependent decarboxylase [Stellaceae bacterium]
MADGDRLSGAAPAILARHPALFPPRAARETWDDRVTQALLAAEKRVANGAVAPTLDLDAFRRDLTGFDFAGETPPELLLDWVVAQMERGVTHMTHPRYFGLFNPAPSYPAQVADRIAAAFNPQLATATTSPAAVEIEAHVIRAVARRAGLPEGSAGHFTTGGAEANATALICALTRAHRDFAAKGARAFPGDPVFYVSRESHLAWFKIAHQCGIGRDAARLVATDGTGRMDAYALIEAIATDRAAGRIPVMVAATAGTTNAGMVDPLSTCAATARANGMWFHVDAAWGGAAMASDTMRGVLAGIEAADSVTIDAHKWFATTMGCGMFLTPHPDALAAAFQVTTGYMPPNTGGVDPYANSAQWSRRFLGLRLFMSLAAAGWAGYARHVEKAAALTAMIEAGLAARGWSIANNSSLAVVCTEPPRGSADMRTIVGRVLASGRAWVSVAQFEGRPVIRACVTHGETTPEDVAVLVEALDAARLD